jgi:hypothetical protein
MSRWFAVLRTRSPNWDHAAPLRRQRLWDEHAAFTDSLEAEGLIKLAGPLEESTDVLLIAKGESAGSIEQRLVEDTWTLVGMLSTTWCDHGMCWWETV